MVKRQVVRVLLGIYGLYLLTFGVLLSGEAIEASMWYLFLFVSLVLLGLAATLPRLWQAMIDASDPMLRLSQIIFAFFGSVMLVYALAYRLAPRAHYIDSQPSAGETLTAVPRTVTVNFSEPLHSTSRITIDAPDGSRMEVTSDLTPDVGTTLRVLLPSRIRTAYTAPLGGLFRP